MNNTRKYLNSLNIYDKKILENGEVVEIESLEILLLGLGLDPIKILKSKNIIDKLQPKKDKIDKISEYFDFDELEKFEEKHSEFLEKYYKYEKYCNKFYNDFTFRKIQDKTSKDCLINFSKQYPYLLAKNLHFDKMITMLKIIYKDENLKRKFLKEISLFGIGSQNVKLLVQSMINDDEKEYLKMKELIRYRLSDRYWIDEECEYNLLISKVFCSHISQIEKKNYLSQTHEFFDIVDYLYCPEIFLIQAIISLSLNR